MIFQSIVWALAVALVTARMSGVMRVDDVRAAWPLVAREIAWIAFVAVSAWRVAP